MTYENAVKWIIENMHLNQFESFKDLWDNGIDQDASFGEVLKKKDKFRDILTREVFKKKPDWRNKPKPDWFVRGGTPIPERRKDVLISGLGDRADTFKPKEIAKELGLNTNTTRRLFQELLKEGFLTRERRGVYRVS